MYMSGNIIVSQKARAIMKAKVIVRSQRSPTGRELKAASFVRNKRGASFRDKRNNKKTKSSSLRERQNKKLMIRKRTRQIIGAESLCTSDFEFASHCYV